MNQETKKVKYWNQALESGSESQQKFSSITKQINDLVTSPHREEPTHYTHTNWPDCSQRSMGAGKKRSRLWFSVASNFPITGQVLSSVPRFRGETLWGSHTHQYPTVLMALPGPAHRGTSEW